MHTSMQTKNCNYDSKMSVRFLITILSAAYLIVLSLRLNFVFSSIVVLFIFIIGALGAGIARLKINTLVLPYFLISFVITFSCVINPSAVSDYLISQIYYALSAIVVVNVMALYVNSYNYLRIITYTIASLFFLIWVVSLFDNKIIDLYMMLPHREEPSFWDSSTQIMRMTELSFTSILLLRPTSLRNVFTTIILTMASFTAPSIIINTINLIKLRCRCITLTFIFLSMVALISYFGYELFSTYAEQKYLSTTLRINRFPDICLLDACGFNSDLNENLVIATAQVSGLLLGILYFVAFMAYLFSISNSLLFILIASLVLFANPFPMALLIIYSVLWKYDEIKYSYRG